MTKEMKLSLLLLAAGAAVLTLYWFMPVAEESVAAVPKRSPVQERVILPRYEENISRNIPEVQAYLSDLKKVIKSGSGVLPLDEGELDATARSVQALLLKNSAFLADVKRDGKVLHNDMMRIIPAILSSMEGQAQQVCRAHKCYQAEKYNFVTNTTTRAIVDAEAMQVLSVVRFPDMQPDISQRLRRIAEAIALHAPEVKRELGFTPLRKDITMANVRGSMKESPCEDTTHLCVAPTFADHQKQQALWAVVDLTEMRLAAAKWAGLGKTTTPACISERILQNRYIMQHFCQKDTILERNGWRIRYRLTGSDGLEIRDVRFKGQTVLTSAKIVDWHVSYRQKGDGEIDTATERYIGQRRVEFVRGGDESYLFGYNDAMGCPMFSTSVVLPFNGPQVRALPTGGGFMLTQDFRNPKWPMACNYRYENRFEFYDNGSFRIVGVNKGRGCGDHAIYRPVMRIDTAMGERENFYRYEDGGWKLWSKEGSEEGVGDREQVIGSREQVIGDEEQGAGSREQGAGRGEKYLYKVTSAADLQRGYYLEPNYGQFGDGSRGDDATLFVTRFHSEEGDSDLLTLGSCCKLKEEGVERYLNDESITGQNLVLWYVPHIYNDARKGEEYCWADTVIGEDGNLHVKVWPCIVGPKFVPIGKRE